MHSSDATPESFLEVVKSKQNTGIPRATLIGFLLVVLTLFDAYLNATQTSGFTAVISSFFSEGGSYRVVFFVSLIIQAIFLVVAARVLINSPWKSFLRHELISTSNQINRAYQSFKSLVAKFFIKIEGVTDGINHIEQKRGGITTDTIVVVSVIFSLAMSWLLVQRLAGSIYLSAVVGLFWMSAIVSVFTLVIAWLAFSVGRACMKDREAIWGGLLGIMIVAISAGYAPSYESVYVNTSGYHEIFSHVSDFQYWEAGLVVFITLLAISVMIESRHHKVDNTVRLHISGDVLERALVTSSPRDTVFLTELHLKVVAEKNAKVIVFARHNEESLYSVVNDVLDDRRTITLNDHDVRVWNLTPLEKRIAGNTGGVFGPIQDTSGSFSISGKLSTLAMTEGYNIASTNRIGLSSLIAVEQYLIEKEDVKSILLSVIAASLNEKASSWHSQIAALQEDLRKLKVLVSTGNAGYLEQPGQDVVGSSAEANYHVKGLAHQYASQKHEQIKRIADLYANELSRIQTAYNNTISERANWVGGFNKWGPEGIFSSMKKRNDCEYMLSELQGIIDTIGLGLSEVRLDVIGKISDIDAQIKDIEDKITTRISEAEKGHDVAVAGEDSDNKEKQNIIIKGTMEDPTIHGSSKVEILKTALGGGPATTSESARIEHKPSREQPT